MVLATRDSGATWAALPTGAQGKARAIAFIDSERGFVAGDNGSLLATEDGGKTWHPRTTGTSEHLTDIHFTGELGWLAAYGGVILHTRDGGRSWTAQPTGVLQPLESIYFADEKHGWAVGWVGTILRTIDGGNTWEQVRAPAAMWSLSSVCFRNLKDGWIVGFGGQILRTRDGGASWEAQESPVRGWLTSVMFDAANRGWIAYDDGLLVSQDGGESWQRTDGIESRFLSRLVPINGSLWAVGPFGAIMQTGERLAWTGVEKLSGFGASGPSIGEGNAIPPEFKNISDRTAYRFQSRTPAP